MSEKCSGCGYYTGACQCRVDDNRCRRCGKILSACTCDVNHTDHWSYDNPKVLILLISSFKIFILMLCFFLVFFSFEYFLAWNVSC